MKEDHNPIHSARKIPIIISLLTVSITTLLFSFNFRTPSAELMVRDRYAAELAALKSCTISLKNDLAQHRDSLWISDFKACRISYKKAECLIAYYYPLIAKRLNGPALMDVEPVDPNESVMPTGFQVMEEDLFDDAFRSRASWITRQADHILSYIGILEAQLKNISVGRSELYDAIRLNLCTMASLGLSGFDTPLSGTAIDEAVATLEETRLLLNSTGGVTAETELALEHCLQFCKRDKTTFFQFDRARFIATRLRPLFAAIYHQQIKQHIPFINKKRAINTRAASFLELNAFDAYFFAPDSITAAGKDLIALGKTLFSEPLLTASGRSCASCHNPSKAFTDGLKSNLSLQRDEHLPRNTPTLINAALQPVQFADSRVKYLEQQAHDVMLNKAEMDGSPDKTVKEIRASVRYAKLFAKAFPGKHERITHENVITAIVAFERSLVRLNAPFDLYMRGDTTAMNALQVQGFNIFMGKAKCGTCHFMPLFNGAVPPFYDRQDAEIIGVPSDTNKAHPVLDGDMGVYDLFHSELKRGAFKTPSIRNAASTAPYMHNGVYKTLEEVIDFYDKGGGAGAGIKMQVQTLPEDKLNLTPQEKKALVAFIQALDDNQF
jgi:cytochrome c peroxidase